MADLNQNASGVKTAIQSDAPSPIVASVAEPLPGNARGPLGNVAQATQNGDGMKIAAVEQEAQLALSQGHGSFGGVPISSSCAYGPGRLAGQRTEDGLQQQIIAHDFTNQLLAYLVTGAFFALIVLLMFSTKPIDTSVKDLLFTLLGVVATSWANIIGFYFGSSAGSAQKSQAISSALLHGKPAQSQSAS